MKTGTCVKSSAETVYFSGEKYLKNGFKTDSGYPHLIIYKDHKWIPDIHSSQVISYVCRTC